MQKENLKLAETRFEREADSKWTYDCLGAFKN